MTRIGRDSVNWSAIPVGTPVVMGYVPPSHFAWPAAAWARFAGSVLVRITPSAGTFGKGIQVLDVETGDATPAQVPGWVNASRGAGQEPTAYMNQSTWGAVIQACLGAQVAVPQFWVANWDGVGDLPTITINGVTYTAIAHQFADPPASGGDWDESIVADYWPGVDQGGNVTAPSVNDIWSGPVYTNVFPKGSAEQLFITNVLGVAPAADGSVQITNTKSGEWLADGMVHVSMVLNTVNSIAAQVGALPGALSANDAALLAAVHGITTGSPTDAQVQAQTQQLLAALPPVVVAAIGAQLAAKPAAPTA